MKEETVQIKVAPELQFRAPNGESIPAQDVEIAVTFVEDQLSELRLIVQVAPETWQRIDAGKWFHLTDDVRGPCFGGEFAADKNIEIEARLSSDSLSLVSITSEDVWDAGAMVYSAPLTGEIKQTENWYGLYVKQAMLPGLKVGFQTTYAPK
jgi:hypothetical protein